MYSSKLSERQNRTAQKKRSLAAVAAAHDATWQTKRHASGSIRWGSYAGIFPALTECRPSGAAAVNPTASRRSRGPLHRTRGIPRDRDTTSVRRLVRAGSFLL